ncbi:MAG: hypothetical protein JXQ27_10175 [Acidobacteria bacterium]|nr:hypothetical protein [Acidobacteriota bacterium]
MKKSFLLINVLLLACIVALTLNLNAEWDQWNRRHSEEAIYEALDMVEPEIQVPQATLPQSPATSSEVALIGDQNLFHRSRNLDLPQEEEKKEAKATPVLKEPPIITGIIQIGSQRKAHVQQVKNRGQEVDNILLDEGDTWIDDWIVKEIGDDRLVLAMGDTEEEVLFHDPNRRDNRAQMARRQAGQPRPTGAANSSVVTIGTKSAATTTSTRPQVTKRTTPRAPTRTRSNIFNRSRNASDSRLSGRQNRDDKTSGLFSSSRSNRSRSTTTRSSSSRRNYSRDNSGRR